MYINYHRIRNIYHLEGESREGGDIGLFISLILLFKSPKFYKLTFSKLLSQQLWGLFSEF